eukprot:TRINITY_DN5143_c0_g1_i1.p1 TRINITY_DN5143_c0_g1~~TRINITY_DN5143_c0_g1_i1.p1  ORF type:complete len:224 (+),score=17.06 TRINITY_DN5143_c0_g1_i1:103-774(+)
MSHYEYLTDIEIDELLWESADVFAGCGCTDDCDSRCSCALRSTFAKYECNARCGCDSSCSNRQSQQPFARAVEIYETNSQGKGLRTLNPIAKGEFFGCYAGEVLSSALRLQRQIEDEAQGNTYLLILNEHTQHGTMTTAVDARYKGNETRFINHSCDPNLDIKPVRERQIPRLCLFAIRDIAAGEPLTFDYGHGSAQEEMSRIKCQCGANKCRGYLPHVSISD